MKGGPCPKPGNTKKKKKLYNGYKDKAERCCYYHGTPYAERHEVFGGPLRQISIEYGFQVDLCPACHRELHDNITDRAKRENKQWKKYYQTKYMAQLMEDGAEKSEALRMWMRLIGRNYLDELIPE